MDATCPTSRVVALLLTWSAFCARTSTALSASNIAIDWASQPAFSNETVLLLGGPFPSDSIVTLTRMVPAGHVGLAERGMRGTVTGISNTSDAPIEVPPLQVTDGSLKFVVPATAPDAQWVVSLKGSPSGVSYTLNAPQPWWVIGDRQQTATPGGYLRVFGNSVAVDSAEAVAARANLHEVRDAAAAMFDVGSRNGSGGGGDGSADIDDEVAAMAVLRRLAALKKQYNKAVAASASVLRLTTPGQPAVLLNSIPENTTRWSAWFALPESLHPGT